MRHTTLWLYAALLILFPGARIMAQPYSFIVDSSSFSSLPHEGGKAGMTIADVNNDGHPDLLSIGDHGSPFIGTSQHGITVWFGNGTATGWTLFQTGDFGYGGISAGDLNNDGKMDVAYGMHHNYSADDFGDQLLEAALGDGTGMNWTPWDDSLGTAGESYGMFGTALADIDHDGLLDIGSTSFGCCEGYHVYRNLGTGAWQHAYGSVGDNAANRFLFGDMNHDGKIDFATTHQNGTPYFGDGTGNFTPAHLNLPVQPTFGYDDISLGDVNNDGADDLCFTMNNGVFVYVFDTTSNLWINFSGFLPSTGFFSGAELHDMNNDGNMDVVAITSNLLRVWHGDGAGTWTVAASLNVSNVSFSKDFVIADVNHNGVGEIFMLGNVPTGGFGNTNKLFIIRDTTSATELGINPINPVSTECILPGGAYFVKWNSTVPANHPASVSIDLSLTGQTGPWHPVANNIVNSGVYQWAVNDTLVSANSYLRFVITDSSTFVQDTSAAGAFNISCTDSIPVAPPEPPDTTLSAGQLIPASLRIFPNPASGYISIESPARPITNLELFSITGNRVAKQEASAEPSFLVRLDVRALARGMYFLRCRAGEEVMNEMIVLE